MAQISYDQSSAVKCKEHGHRSGLFIRPDAGDSFPAFYTCLHCANAKKVPTSGSISKDAALSLPRLK
jgi:hypothetical protein